MVGAACQVSFPLLDNIRAQPKALRQVAEYQLGPGRNALARSTELMRSVKRVMFSGMGASLFAAIPAACSLGAEVIDSSELLYFPRPGLDANTTVVLVSRSGESVEVTKLLPVLRQAGCRVIGVTNVPDSPLAAGADQAIILHSPADQLVAIQTYTATLLTLLLLADSDPGDLGVVIDEMERQIGIWIAASDDWREFLSSERAVYLLGRSPALGSVQEGALLFHETAKAAAVGMPVAQFRHGPVEVVDAAFRAVVFGTVPETLDLDSALAEDLMRMGAKICWIGPGSVSSRSVGFNVEPHRFARLLEIVPCQLLAYRMAEWKGLRPGDFRWASTVTRSETGFEFADSR
jgi:glucosamine--fructose-6-phosphate aminotransferase (isomerizing)